MRLVVALAAAALIALPAGFVGAASGPATGQRIDLKVLILTQASDSISQGWEVALAREGIPYTTITVPNGTTNYFSDSTLADYATNHAKFQAVIVSNPNTGDLAMTSAEQLALSKLETTFGIRQITDRVFAGHGLGTGTQGTMDGLTGTLEPAGRLVFPYLQGNIPIPDNDPSVIEVWGAKATPTAGAAFATLVRGQDGSAYVGIYTHPDGIEEMVSTIPGDQYQLHEQLMRHGMIGWVTRGAYLGYQRDYLNVEVDDVFMPDDRWNTELNKTSTDSATPAADEYTCVPNSADLPCLTPIRMTPADVTRLLVWQSSNGLKLDMVFNGAGSVEAGAGDALTSAFMGAKTELRWVNHTYSHLDLTSASLDQIKGDISNNLSWASSHGLPLDSSELVTGGHSGLDNPYMPTALSQLGIGWVAADNSLEQTQRVIGPARTVPRYPSNVYYNVGTQAEQLDEYNYIYLPAAQGGKCTSGCLSAPASWDSYLGSETNIMFPHLLGNDPKPHFAHQSNLSQDGVLYSLLDRVIARYKGLYSTDLVQLPLAGAGQELQRQSAWKSQQSGIYAYLLNHQVHVINTTGSAVTVPLTGTSVGSVYGGQRSGLVSIPPASEKVFDLDGFAATPSETGGTPPSGGILGANTSGGKKLTLTRLRMKPSRFWATGRHSGATLSFTVSGKATLRLSFQRVATGRKVRGVCRRPTAKNRDRRFCRRYVSVGGFSRSVAAGAGKLRISGKLNGRALRPGTYRLVVKATAAGVSSSSTSTKSVKFVVLTPRPRR